MRVHPGVDVVSPGSRIGCARLSRLPQGEGKAINQPYLRSVRLLAEALKLTEAQRSGFGGLARGLGGAARPGFALAELATKVRDESSDLDTMDARDTASSIRAAFSWSHDQLSPGGPGCSGCSACIRGPDVAARPGFRRTW